MCGIVGVFSIDNKLKVSEKQLIRMRDTMAHRGPDDAGIYVQQTNQYFIGLAHRRLSILDLSAKGHQPMSIDDGALKVVFNGEIFNFKELRSILSEKGKYNFQSNSDTEVLLYSIREWGIEGALKRFRGMFAFALFNHKIGELTIVRDSLGVKPLYYYYDKKSFVFASEIKAILSWDAIKMRLDEKAMFHYLTFANVPTPYTLFKNIRKLEPGTFLKIDHKGSIRKKRYWDPSIFKPSTEDHDESGCVKTLRFLLRQSVARRMVSDVPFGVFLSGGIDSSINVALMAEMMENPVETFSVGIKGDPANELRYARKVSEYFGTNHHEILLDTNDFIRFLPEMAYLQDEPLADPVCIPIYYLSKLARQSGTIVIQVGEGSDEIFAGYGMYQKFLKFDRFAYKPFLKLPRKIKALAHSRFKGVLPTWLSDALLRAWHNEPLFLGNAIAFWDTEKFKMLRKPNEYETSGALIKNISSDMTSMDSLLRIINVELKNRLPELLLMRVDKMSMANSIETRVPFLDEDLVKFVLSIPSNMKYKNGQTKYILKKAAEGILPNEIIYRRKWGFCGSATNMLTEPIAAYAKETIINSKFNELYLDQDEISRLFFAYNKSHRFNSFKIWNLLNIVLWHEHWFN